MQSLIRHRQIFITVICLGVLAVFFGSEWWGYPWPRRLDLAFRDYIMREGRLLPKDDRLVFLAIDEATTTVDPLDLDTLYSDIPRDSADFRALSLISKEFPWSREVYALALDKLVGAGAAVVAIDLLFNYPGPGDSEFRAALDRYPAKVIVATNFEVTADGERLVPTQTVPNVALIPQTTPMDSRTAFNNFFPSPYDGVVRSAQFKVWNGQLANYPRKPDDETFLSIAANAVTKAGAAHDLPAGFAPSIIRFAGPNGTFAPRSLFEIFVPKYWSRNYQDGAFWKGKIVIIGPSADRFHDFIDTPFGKASAMPGAEMHLQAMNAALKHGFLSESPPWFERLALILTAATVVGVGFISASPLRRFLIVLANGLIGVAAAVIAYNYFDLHLATANPLLNLGLCGLGAFAVDFTAERLERARTRREFEQYMSANVVRAVLDDRHYARNVERGFRKSVTILFSDLRGFTALTESLAPEDLVSLLNEYLSEMVKCVFRHNGTLDKFVGDAVMAVWGNTPLSKGDAGDAVDAVRAALDMLNSLEELNAKWRAEGRRELQIGIGINHGDVTVGNLGSSQKKELTVIGDPVNLASRLEGLTKNYGVSLLVGESMAGLIRDHFVLQPVDLVQVVGKTRPTEIFTILREIGSAAAERSIEGIAEYCEGLQRYRERNASAAFALLTKAATLRPNDPIIRRYLDLASQRLAEGENAQWEDVTVMTKK